MENHPNAPFPEGFARMETCDGRWFPAFARLTDAPQVVVLVRPSLIPAALEPLEDPKQGYRRREEAIAAYCAWHEAVTLPIQWETLAAHTQVYPERTIWYEEEIYRLAGERPKLVSGTYVFAGVVAARDGVLDAVAATGANPDEAIEVLYQHVADWYCTQQEEEAEPLAS
jgi:hypothetical protein